MDIDLDDEKNSIIAKVDAYAKAHVDEAIDDAFQENYYDDVLSGTKLFERLTAKGVKPHAIGFLVQSLLEVCLNNGVLTAELDGYPWIPKYGELDGDRLAIGFAAEPYQDESGEESDIRTLYLIWSENGFPVEAGGE